MCSKISRVSANLDIEFPHADPLVDDLFASGFWNVVTGDNGTGKTTLLKAVAFALVGPTRLASLQPSLSGWLREGAENGLIAVQIQASAEDQFKQGRPYQVPFWSELGIRRESGPEPVIEKGNKFGTAKKQGPTHGPWAENPKVWFAAGYGPFRRLYGESTEGQRLMIGPSQVARFATMFREDASLGECERWMKDLQFRALASSTEHQQLLQQVTELINADFLIHGFRVEEVKPDGLVLRDAAGLTLSLRDMSEGYRSALALLTDILRHMAVAYGAEGLVRTRDGRPIVPHSGAILIDEIDAHLHPEWQRRISFWLMDHFPNVQFIVTTHSPLICQAASDDGVFTLAHGTNGVQGIRLSTEEVRRIKDSKSDAILLTPAFGMTETRSPKAVENRQNYAQLRANQYAGRLTTQQQSEMKFIQERLFPDPEDGEWEAANAASGS